MPDCEKYYTCNDVVLIYQSFDDLQSQLQQLQAENERLKGIERNIQEKIAKLKQLRKRYSASTKNVIKSKRCKLP